LAAPSSPKWPPPGSGSWTAKARSSSNIARDRAVEHLLEIGRRHVQPVVGRVLGRGHRRGVRGPHGRGARDEPQQVLVVARGGGDDLLVGAGEAERAQRPEGRPRMGRKDGLRDAEAGDELHLREALERGLARIRDVPAVRGRREVADRKAAVVVGRTDQAVELMFSQGAHGAAQPTPAKTPEREFNG
jgi:hypothetical protein